MSRALYRDPMMIRPVLALLFVAPALAQVVHIGPKDPDYCSKFEKVLPNLELRNEVHILGSIQDQTTAPLQNSRVELRRYISQINEVNVQVVSTDDKGRFDLGIIKPGKYRLLASPHRGFKQPATLLCQNGHECELKITLIVNPTD